MFSKKSDAAPQVANDHLDVKAGASTPKRPEISIDISGMDGAKAKASNSIIDEWLTMTGDLESEGDILVKGKIRGNINCKLLIIDEMATVDGGMVAEQIVVRGTTKGTIRTSRAIFEKSARVDSEIFHSSFAVEEGAQIRGALHYSEKPMLENAADKKAEPAAKASGSAKAAAVPVTA